MNCAGSLLLKPAHLTTEKEWRDTVDLSLTTPFATVLAAAKTMILREAQSRYVPPPPREQVSRITKRLRPPRAASSG